MKKISLFSAVLAAGLLFPLVGAAQAPQADAQPREARAQRAARPQLTDAQRDAMRKLREDHREAGEAARKELRELHTQLAKELSAAQINNGRVNELKTQIAQKQSAITVARIDQRAKVAALLTPEQRQAMGERAGRMLERGPREGMNARGPRGMAGARGMRGAQGMRGQGMRGPQRPGMMRQRGANDAQLRQRIEKLERELEELRKKIG